MGAGAKDTVSLPNGETIAYCARSGGDVPVVLLHGNLSSARYWDAVFERMDDRFSLYAPDMRGFGDSTYEHPIDSLGPLADDVLQFTDALGIEDYAIWGWSAGAGVAMRVAIAAPEALTRLVLMGPPSTQGLPIYERDDSLESTGRKLGTREELAEDPLSVGPAKAALAAGDPDEMQSLLRKLLFVNGPPADGRFETYVEETLKQQNLLDAMYALTNFNVSSDHSGVAPGTGEAGDIDLPTLVIRGADDQVSTADMAARVVRDLPQAEFVELEHCGHAPVVDAPDRVVSEVESFLTQ